MNLFKELVEGVTKGFVASVSERSDDPSANDVVEACCRELGWSIDERLAANKIGLHFKDPRFGIRRVIVNAGCRDGMVAFTVFSAAILPAREVPADILGYLLERNGTLLVTWQIQISEEGNVNFLLDHHAFAAGLRPGFFKGLCDTMVREAQDFDERMHKAGLLR
jgi:hypothetical protein